VVGACDIPMENTYQRAAADPATFFFQECSTLTARRLFGIGAATRGGKHERQGAQRVRPNSRGRRPRRLTVATFVIAMQGRRVLLLEKDHFPR